MPKYSTGTSGVTNGSQLVIGDVDANWQNVKRGDIFEITAGKWYQIASTPVKSGGFWQLYLARSYEETTNSAADYSINTGYTPEDSIPYPEPGDTQSD